MEDFLSIISTIIKVFSDQPLLLIVGLMIVVLFIVISWNRNTVKKPINYSPDENVAEESDSEPQKYH